MLDKANQWHDSWLSLTQVGVSINKHKAVASCEAAFCERVIIDGWHWALLKCLKLKHTIETLHIFGYSNICSAILT